MNRGCALALLLLLTDSLAWAEPTVVLGDPQNPASHTYDLRQNQAGQQIQIYVSGGDSIAGIDFNMELDSDAPAIAPPSAPSFTGVDLTTGTIFQNNNLGAVDSGSLPTDELTWWITTESGVVSANGLLATVTVDTTGLFASDPVHSWPLSMSETDNGSTEFLNSSGVALPASFTDGTITLVAPEPHPLALLGIGVVALAGYVCCQRAQKWASTSRSLADEKTHSSDLDADLQQECPAILSLPPRWAEATRRAA